MQCSKKRGQLSVIVILGIILVGVLLLILIRPEIPFIPFLAGEINPDSYLRDCLAEPVEENIALLGSQGGYANPEGYILFQDNKVKYLCYTNQNYETCVVQQPAIKNHFEGELEVLLIDEINTCVGNLKESYERRGFDVSLGAIDSEVLIVPGRIEINVNSPMTITKDTSSTFSGFEIELESEMYDLLLLATSLVDFEATFGDAQTSLYYQYYPDLIIEKNVLGEGTTVYKLRNVITEESFSFASRSLVFPAGLV